MARRQPIGPDINHLIPGKSDVIGITSAAFQADGLLILTFDESFFNDTENGGGHVATLIISSKAKPGFKSTTFYQHQSLLKLMLQSLGVSSFPGAAASAPEMSEFFQ